MNQVEQFLKEKFNTSDGRNIYTKEDLINFATEYNKQFLLDLSKKLDEQCERMAEFKNKLEDVLLPNDLDYLDKHWAQKEKRIESIIQKLKEELPKMEGRVTEVAKGLSTDEFMAMDEKVKEINKEFQEAVKKFDQQKKDLNLYFYSHLGLFKQGNAGHIYEYTPNIY